MDYLRLAQSVSVRVRDYLSDVLPLARQTASVTFLAVQLHLRLVARVCSPLITVLIHLYHYLIPVLTLILRQLYILFTLQPPHVLAFEALTCLFLLLLTLLERRFGIVARIRSFHYRITSAISSRYHRFRDHLYSKSRLAASILPHALFFTLAFITHTSIGHLIAPFTRGAGMVLLACVHPAIRTLLLLYRLEISDPRPTRRPSTFRERTRLMPPLEDLTPDSDSDPPPDDRSDPDYTPSSTLSRDTPNSTTLRRSRRRAALHAQTDLRQRAATVAAAIADAANDNHDSNCDSRTGASSSSRAVTPASTRRVRIQSVSPDPSARIPASTRTSSPRPPEARAAERAVLRFWVVFGVVWAARSFTWFFCPVVLEGVVTAVDARLFYLFIWAQLSLTRGADVVYDLIARFARRRWHLGPREGVRRLNAIMRLLVAMRIVEEERASKLMSVVEESGLALLGVLFLITPRWTTFLGTLAIGLIVPCYLTMVVLEGRARDDMIAIARHNWLSYWGVFSLVDAGFSAGADVLGWMPLWYHTKMVIILWLQLPYYRGSVIILDWFMERVGLALSSVRQQTVTPKKRKRA